MLTIDELEVGKVYQSSSNKRCVYVCSAPSTVISITKEDGFQKARRGQVYTTHFSPESRIYTEVVGTFLIESVVDDCAEIRDEIAALMAKVDELKDELNVRSRA